MANNRDEQPASPSAAEVGRFVECHRAGLLRWGQKNCRATEDDLAEAIVRFLARYTDRPKPLWLQTIKRIVRNVAIDRWRRKERAVSSLSDLGPDATWALIDTGPTPEQAALLKELIVTSVDVLSQSEIIDRWVVLGKWLGYSTAEQAADLGLTEAAIRGRRRRAAKKFKLDFTRKHGGGGGT